MYKDDGAKIEFITVNEIIEIHDDAISHFGGEKGILNRGNLEFIVEFIKVQFFEITFDNFFWIASLIIWYIINGHPFVDGNKRTGMEVADLFLRKNGYLLVFTTDEGFEFALSIARGEKDVKSIYKWVLKHSEKL